MKKLLFLVPLQIFAMEQTDIVVYVAPELPKPSLPRESFITGDDIKRWATMELDARDIGVTARIKALSDRLDIHERDNSSAHLRTRAALAATIITTICGVTTTLVTYFTTRDMGSN